MEQMTMLGMALGALLLWGVVLSVIISSSTKSKKLVEQNDQIIALLKTISDRNN